MSTCLIFLLISVSLTPRFVHKNAPTPIPYRCTRTCLDLNFFRSMICFWEGRERLVIWMSNRSISASVVADEAVIV
ncbi:hypothetical protein BDV34DRAFT_205418 [Aspergillus parasiticus]|uniref:Secreted protein n=1 Tax=Aspergillus parasiticus TaxID=5067 RepID=A0A5N6D737_ASPPA|nr:hypothetical protein BDV34DRAFT_205418 [Aspergillus parasiticus]